MKDLPIRPILATLRHQKISALLIVLEVALACAILANATHLILHRTEAVLRDYGLPEQELLVLGMAGVPPGVDPKVQTELDLRALSAIPGVKAAAVVNQVLYGVSSSVASVSLTPDRSTSSFDVSAYMGSQRMIEAMGLRLIDGRGFEFDEMAWMDDLISGVLKRPVLAIINRAMAQELFPTLRAVGQNIYMTGRAPVQVVGVVEQLPQVQPGHGTESTGYAMILSIQPDFNRGSYILRTSPLSRDAVLQQATQQLKGSTPGRFHTSSATLTEMRNDYYRSDKRMVALLSGTSIATLTITALGIVGLVSLWVEQRSRMIGIRRALGATITDIRRYFQIENALLCGVGVLLGMLGAVFISVALSGTYGLPTLPWFFLPTGATTLMLLGQLAILAPARHAAQMPAALAMRA